MMRKFLEAYVQSINLDDKQYARYFPPKVNRADFLLFDKQVVCEFKGIENMKIKNNVEKISRKINLSERDLKSMLFKRIRKVLNSADRQISDTKKAFDCHEAFGLVILENLIPDNLSVLSLISAADKEMVGGLNNVDCVLCLDFINTFSNSEDRPIRYAQVVTRGTEKAERLCELLDQMMTDFCNQLSTPLFKDVELEKGEEVWSTDESGKYRNYRAKLAFKLPVTETRANWRQKLARFLGDWWWVFLLSTMDIN